MSFTIMSWQSLLRSAPLALGLIAGACNSAEEAKEEGAASGVVPAEGDLCVPVGDGCEVSVIDGPESGAACLAMRDNEAADRVQLRQVWNRALQPVGNTIDLVYGTLLLRADLPLIECNMRGLTGYIKAVDWDRSSSDITQQTARVGWVDFESEEAVRAAAAPGGGLCMVDFEYTDPDHGLDDGWAIAPVVQRRVAADFSVSDVRDTVPEGEGIFYFDEAKNIGHHYSPLEYVVIFDDKLKVVALPIHDVEMTIRYNDASLNCAGAYQPDRLDVSNDCFTKEQGAPAWGNADGSSPGEGPIETTGYFVITEIEKVYTTVLQSTLCVSYPGQQNSIDDGWADPADWGLNCSGSPKWNPADPENGLPHGDWCSATNSDSTDTCHDAWRSRAMGVMSAFNVKTTSCATDAHAAGEVTK